MDNVQLWNVKMANVSGSLKNKSNLKVWTLNMAKSTKFFNQNWTWLIKSNFSKKICPKWIKRWKTWNKECLADLKICPRKWKICLNKILLIHKVILKLFHHHLRAKWVKMESFIKLNRSKVQIFNAKMEFVKVPSAKMVYVKMSFISLVRLKLMILCSLMEISKVNKPLHLQHQHQRLLQKMSDMYLGNYSLRFKSWLNTCQSISYHLKYQYFFTVWIYSILVVN